MKEQVIMGPNGQLGVAIPLYPNYYEKLVIEAGEYALSVSRPDKPLAYAIDQGEKNLGLANAEFVEANAEFLGDL